MPKQREQRESRSEDDESSAREESLNSRELAVEAQEEELRTREQTAAEVRLELEALMASLQEANGHLVVANLRTQALAEQMNQLYEDARRAVEAKDELFTLISHELRTPLTSITGWAALLARTPDQATVAEAASAIASSAALQAKLIDDLLDVSRIMTGKFAIIRERVDLYAVIDDSLSVMRPLAAAKGVSLRTGTQHSAIINGDAARLRQVFTNLLSNAIKFTPAGGLIEIYLKRGEDDSFAVAEVCDTGEGISSAFLPYVFDRRSQATARRFAGLGLGLAIVKHIVELHGGSVTAASDGEGRGSTFTVRIPCAD